MVAVRCSPVIGGFKSAAPSARGTTADQDQDLELGQPGRGAPT
jgi:hypothetical protein